MRGLMQDRPLTLTHVFHRAEQLFGHKTLVTATADGEIATTLAEWARPHPPARRRARHARHQRRRPGRHVRLEHRPPPRAVLRGAVHRAGCCTRSTSGCSPSSSIYIANHAEDEVIFVDRSLLPLLWPLLDTTEDGPARRGDGRRRRRRDPRRPADRSTTRTLLADAEPVDVRRRRTRTRPPSMCYTSGTTGNPKGVVYSHRSTFLHSLVAMIADGARRCRSATSSCRSSRCSTPTPGASPTPPCWRARRWSCPGPT